MQWDFGPVTERMRRLLRRLDRWQRRRAWIAFPVAVVRKFADDRASRHAVRIAYYAFFSVFPLLLAFVSIVGFVLQDDPSRRDDILNSAYAEMQVVGPLVRSDIGTIGGSGVALAVGIGVALWSGLGITLAFGQALDRRGTLPRSTSSVTSRAAREDLPCSSRPGSRSSRASCSAER